MEPTSLYGAQASIVQGRRISSRSAHHIEIFTRWVNRQLHRVGKPPLTTDLIDSFNTGIILANLHFALTGQKIPVTGGARPHAAVCRANINAVLQAFGEDRKIYIRDISAEDIYRGDYTHVMSFIWQLVRRYDSSATGKTMHVWLEEQEALRIDLREEVIQAALDRDLSRVRATSLTRIAEEESHTLNAEELNDDELGEAIYPEEEDEELALALARYEAEEAEREKRFNMEKDKLKARFFAEEIDQMMYLKEKNRLFEAASSMNIRL